MLNFTQDPAHYSSDLREGPIRIFFDLFPDVKIVIGTNFLRSIIRNREDMSYLQPFFTLIEISETTLTVCLYECESYLFLNRFKNVSKIKFPEYSGNFMADT